MSDFFDFLVSDYVFRVVCVCNLGRVLLGRGGNSFILCVIGAIWGQPRRGRVYIIVIAYITCISFEVT